MAYLKHSIELNKAKKLIDHFKEKKHHLISDEYKGKANFPISETFDREDFDRLLSHPECLAVRLYYGLSEDHTLHAVIVGVDKNNEDILPVLRSEEDGVMASATEENPIIIEQGRICPPYCATTSLLNF